LGKFARYSLTLRTRLQLSLRLREIMKTRYRLIRRGIRGNAFYCVDTKTGKRTSLGTDNEDDARQIVEAKNQSERQPVLNLQIAKAYLAGTDFGESRQSRRASS
jgi:hypothetical protein